MSAAIEKRERIRRPSSNPADYETIARLIAPDGSPAWLADHFRAWVGSLFLDRGIEATQPTRAEMRSLLGQAADAAETLCLALEFVPVRDFLEGPRNESLPDARELSGRLSDLAARARRAMSSDTLATKRGVTKPGPGKALPAHATSPETYCAILISEAWKYLRGEEPPDKNTRVLQAAELLWRAAGGAGSFQGEEPYAKWRSYFKAARRSEATQLRLEIRRHLGERQPRPIDP
jgi:hypothetical protein